MKKNLALSIAAALVVGVAGIGMAHDISLPNGGSLENKATLSKSVNVNVNVAKYGSFALTGESLTLNFDAPDTQADMGEVLSTPVGYSVKANCPVRMTIQESVSAALVNRGMNRLKVWPNNLGTDQEWVVAIQPVIDTYNAVNEKPYLIGGDLWGVQTYKDFANAGSYNGQIYLMGTWRFDTDTAAGVESKEWYTLTSGSFKVDNGIVATVAAL